MTPKLAWTLIMGLIMALGFQLVSPNVRIARVEAQTTMLVQQMDMTNRTVRALGKKACFDSTPEQRAFLDLPCNELLNPRLP